MAGPLAQRDQSTGVDCESGIREGFENSVECAFAPRSHRVDTSLGVVGLKDKNGSPSWSLLAFRKGGQIDSERSAEGFTEVESEIK